MAILKFSSETLISFWQNWHAWWWLTTYNKIQEYVCWLFTFTICHLRINLINHWSQSPQWQNPDKPMFNQQMWHSNIITTFINALMYYWLIIHFGCNCTYRKMNVSIANEIEFTTHDNRQNRGSLFVRCITLHWQQTKNMIFIICYT